MITLSVYITLIALFALFAILGLKNDYEDIRCYQNRFYSDIISCLIACMLAFMLAMFSVNGEVQMIFSETCANAQNCGFFTNYVPMREPALSYFFTGLGAAFVIITLLKVIDASMRYFVNVEQVLEGGDDY